MKRFIAFLLAAALLCPLLACSAAPAGNTDKPVNTDVPATDVPATDEPTAAATDVPDVDPTDAPLASNSTPIYIRKAAFMDPGALSVSVNVLKWIADEGYNAGAKYDVVCEICFLPGAAEYKYNGKTLGEYRNDPALAAFNEEYQAWFIETFVKDFADAYLRAKNGEEEAYEIVYGDIYQRFYDEWCGRQDEETIRAYNEAFANYNDAFESYWKDGWQDPSGTDCGDALAAELARLASLGYEFEIVEDSNGGSYAFILGKLSIEQIWSFSADADWAYYLSPYSDQYGIEE